MRDARRQDGVQISLTEVCLPGCEQGGENPQMEVAAKPEAAIDKGMAGPGLLAYIVTSKFSDYLPAVSVGRHFRAPRICDLAGDAVGLVW